MKYSRSKLDKSMELWYHMYMSDAETASRVLWCSNNVGNNISLIYLPFGESEKTPIHCSIGEIGRHVRFRCVCLIACGFESHIEHHAPLVKRLRRRPLKAESPVQFRYGVPDYSGNGAVWQRASFGTKRSQVQILFTRPSLQTLEHSQAGKARDSESRMRRFESCCSSHGELAQ